MSKVELELDAETARLVQDILEENSTSDSIREVVLDIQLQVSRMWDENKDQLQKCLACDHVYARHFDSYEDMYPIGCKYCSCRDFME